MKKLIVVFYSLVVALACDPCRKDPSCDGDIKLSEIENKTDYMFPLSMSLDIDRQVFLNGEKINFVQGIFQFPHSGFYEMVLFSDSGSDTIVFNLLDPERGTAEWGLKKWVPVDPFFNDVTASTIELNYPKNKVSGINIPIVVTILQNGRINHIFNECIYSGNNSRFSIKNGEGSIQVPSDNLAGNYFQVGGIEIPIEVVGLNSNVIELNGSINNHFIIPANSVVRINQNLVITENGSLIVGEGSIVLVESGINIYNSGPIAFNGTKQNPILVTGNSTGKLWGGFISDGPSAEIYASNTFFCYSGFHVEGEFNLGHAKRQALFQTSNSNLILSSCYILDNAGQIFYPENSVLDLDNVIVQRAKTGGQLNGSTVSIVNCIFTDFPDESQNFQDSDNDGLYINGSNVNIYNSVFMFAKDDGIDSGGGEGGEVSVVNCIFEACFHEGAALSSNEPSVKNHVFKNCFFRNNQQGLELGYSSSKHNVVVDSCIFENNHVGIRFGDNYEWSNEGILNVSNTISINNDRDVWNMNHLTWAPKLDHIQFINTKVSKKSSQYPQLEIFQ